MGQPARDGVYPPTEISRSTPGSPAGRTADARPSVLGGHGEVDRIVCGLPFLHIPRTFLNG